jgi:YHS domain-containing protein
VIKRAKNKVCGMEIDEKTAPAKSEHRNKTYYFCAPACKKAFGENSAKYTKGEGLDVAGLGSRDEGVRNILRALEAILEIDAYCLQYFGI